MASMSQNNSSRSLMGFSVHQPALGATLQFFPAMGSQQLDEMIDAYIPGHASILDKRTAVSLEFFEHTMQTGDLFKFFLVYPAAGSSTASASPASTWQDSGYGSSFNTSPVRTESIWRDSTNEWPFSTSNKKARSNAKKAATSSSKAQVADFSHIPGMKIMTKEGLDVTNAASRGCKTKEQRDHAHLMRIMKACDSCKRKKTRCDPSHKKRSATAAVSAESKTSRKVKKTASQAPQRAPDMTPNSQQASFDTMIAEPLSFDADLMAAADSTLVDWDQFIKYDTEMNDVVPQDYDFFYDPAGYFSPTVTDNSNSASLSPSQILTPGLSQPVTPASGLDVDGSLEFVGGVASGLDANQQPTLPYLHGDGGVEAGSNYVDFALYSPGSSCLDDDPALVSEVAAARGPDCSDDQQFLSRNRPYTHAILRGEVANASHDAVDHDLLSNTAHENVLGSGMGDSLPLSRGAVQPLDHTYFDPGNDRDQRPERSSRHVSGLSSRTAFPATETRSRVPSTTVAPSDTLLGLPPQLGSQALPVAIGGIGIATAIANSIKTRHSPQSLPARPASSDHELGLVSALDPSTQEGVAQPLTSTAQPEHQTIKSGVQQQHYSDFRHQLLQKDVVLGKTEGVVHASAIEALGHGSPTTDGFAERLGKQPVKTRSADKASRSGVTVPSLDIEPVAHGLESRAQASEQPGRNSLRSQAAYVAGNVVEASTSTSAQLSSGVVSGLVQVNTRASDVTADTSTAYASHAVTVVSGVLPTIASAVLCQGLGSALLSRGNGLQLLSSMLLALVYAAILLSSHSYASHQKKSGPFTRALGFVQRISDKTIGNVKSQIQKAQSGFLNLNCVPKTGGAPHSRPAWHNHVVSHMGTAY